MIVQSHINKFFEKRFGSPRAISYIHGIIKGIKVMTITETIRPLRFGNKPYEVIKNEFFVDSEALACKASKLAQSENNDCVVRAFMCGFDISYEQAHAWVAKNFFRKNNKGTQMDSDRIKEASGKTKNGKKVSFIGAHPSKNHINKVMGNNEMLVNKKYKKQTGFTLKSFIENNPVGRFVLIVQGHAVAVVDGVLHGNSDEKYWGFYRSVWYGFELK